MYLEKINNPADLRNLKTDELSVLCEEIRNAIIFKVSNVGGHVGPNLGVVELTVALHYVFDSPKDKIVWDVSHQCYPHKIITGRKKAFLNPDLFKSVTGYTNPAESEHDVFKIGHTSTSVSLALGLARGRDAVKGNNNVIAVIGDGSLSGGEALEGLDLAGEYDNNLIIVVNDNDQSIAENHGGMYKKLEILRDTNGESKDNIFKGLNLDYRYLDDGHDIIKLTELFESVKDINHPIVLHIHTVKGKGLPYAENNKEDWHYSAPFEIESGNSKFVRKIHDTTVFESIKSLLDTDDKAIVITAATPKIFDFDYSVRKEYAECGKFVDVGIAEETAVAMASGISKAGGNPVIGLNSTFMQRTYDQLTHDLCLNNNKATILVFSAGVYGMTSDTHLGLCDIQLLSHIPNMTYLAPISKTEYKAMFCYATKHSNSPIAIRLPSRWTDDTVEIRTDYTIKNKSVVINSGKDVALIAVGSLMNMALEVAQKYKNETGNSITVINPVFLSGLDENLLENLKKNHKLVITLEDGELDGGYGQRISSFYGMSNMAVKNFGISKKFHTDFIPDELLKENGISVENIIKTIKNFTDK